MEVYWLEQTEGDVPPTDEWLSEAEIARLATMRIPKRRGDWRLGRWTAKRAIAAYLNLVRDITTLPKIEVRPAPCGAPEAFLNDKVAPVSISISHRAGAAICAVTTAGSALGCDLEVVEAHSDAFVADYFTGPEQALLTRIPVRARRAVISLLWSAKESGLKALREGLRLDTRAVEVHFIDGPESLKQNILAQPPLVGHWSQFVLLCNDGQKLEGWWQQNRDRLRTLVASPLPDEPIQLSPGLEGIGLAVNSYVQPNRTHQCQAIAFRDHSLPQFVVE